MVFEDFKMDYDIPSLGLRVARENPVKDPSLQEIIDIVSKLHCEDDYIYFCKTDNDNWLLFCIEIEFNIFDYRVHLTKGANDILKENCSFEETIRHIENYDTVLNSPIKFGFEYM